MSKKSISSKNKSATHLPIASNKKEGSNKHAESEMFKNSYRNGSTN